MIIALPALLLFAYGLLVGGLYLFQRAILFQPSRERPVLDRAQLVGVQDVTLVTADGLHLLAWHVPAPAGAPTVLYLHGNAGHIGHRSERLRAIVAEGWGALLTGYRGYGGNPGQPSEQGLLADARAAYAWLLANGVPPDRIVVWGESLGSGVAAQLSAEAPVAAVVLETPFTSIAAIARRRYPFVPVDLLLKDRFDSLARMPRITVPVLIAVAMQDRVVPPAMGAALHAAAGGPAEYWAAPLAGHADLLAHGLMQVVARFVRRGLPHG